MSEITHSEGLEMVKNGDEMLTVTQAAEELGITGQQVRNYIKAGRLPAQRFGNMLLVRRADLESMPEPEPGRKRGRKPGSVPWNKGKAKEAPTRKKKAE
jgi:excisionase family DNA binding protein